MKTIFFALLFWSTSLFAQNSITIPIDTSLFKCKLYGSKFRMYYDQNELFCRVDYHSNGAISQVQFYLDGKRNGLSICYYPSGKTMLLENYLHDAIIGKRTIWYENGQIKETGQYQLKDKKMLPQTTSDTITEWHPEVEEKIMKVLVSSGSVPAGVWKYYNEEGILIKEDFFNDKGEYIETKNYPVKE